MIEIGLNKLSIEDFAKVVVGGQKLNLSQDPVYRQHLQKGCDFLASLYNRGEVVYGVTTGYGESCSVSMVGESVNHLPRLLADFHGCGMGADFSPRECRAILLARLASISKGYSAIRPEVMDRMVLWLNQDCAPRIPQEGSVGASGDLTPLSYIAAALMGGRDLYVKGIRQTSAHWHESTNLKPLELLPKETLGIMNGTSAMTGVAALCLNRAEYLARLTCSITAMGLVALRGNKEHFSEKLFHLKPYPGQMEAASLIRRDLDCRDQNILKPTRVQERYSFRCAPHVVGVLYDALPWIRSHIEIELNSVNDNPVIDPEAQMVYHGGHFYGGHIAFAMDGLKNLLANQADLLDRQMAILVNEKSNNGLSANLSGAQGAYARDHHGLKAVQIAVSSYTAEALKLTMPASVFSRSTECHNQDKVSMGTHAARDCTRVAELLEQVCTCVLYAATQGIYLRVRSGEFSTDGLSPSLKHMMKQVHHCIPPLEEDRELEGGLRKLMSMISTQSLNLLGGDV